VAVSLTIAFFEKQICRQDLPRNCIHCHQGKGRNQRGRVTLFNALVNPYRNYLNEPYIIRSYPLIEKVVEELNFEVAFFQEGNIKTTEVYGLPVKVKLLTKNGSYGPHLYLKYWTKKVI